LITLLAPVSRTALAMAQPKPTWSGGIAPAAATAPPATPVIGAAIVAGRRKRRSDTARMLVGGELGVLTEALVEVVDDQALHGDDARVVAVLLPEVSDQVQDAPVA